MKWYLEVLRKYFVFQGRSCLKEFWWFTLFDLIINTTILFLGVFIAEYLPFLSWFAVLGIIAYIVTFIPKISLTIRRMHDIGMSGWWVLLRFIPIISIMAALIFYISDSEPFENKYGPPPN